MTGDLFNPVQRWAEIDGPGECYRWVLGEIWDPAIRPMLVVGHNPSTADAQKDDPTWNRWRHFGKAWGHGGVIAVNFHPLRATDPRKVYQWLRQQGAEAEDERRRVAIKNLQMIAHWDAICSRAVACWGAMGYGQLIDRIVGTLGEPIHCFGTNDDGSPKHVMARGKHRVPDDQQPIVWDYRPEV